MENNELEELAAFYAARDAAVQEQVTATEPTAEPAQLSEPAPVATLNDYYIRCKEADKDKLYELATALGILTNNEGTYSLDSKWEGGWSEVGVIYRDGEPICDSEGNPYWHVNLRLKIASLTDHAIKVAETNPDVAAALSDLAGWFVADAAGVPVPPKQPAQVWL